MKTKFQQKGTLSLKLYIRRNRIWLPKNVQKDIGSNFFRVSIGGTTFITHTTKDGRFFIPKNVRKLLHTQNNQLYTLKVQILSTLPKPNKFLKGKFIDVLYFVPQTTLSGFPVIALEEGQKLRLWYSTKGRPNEILIYRYLPIEFMRFVGYFQAEGGKTKLAKRRGRELNFTNTSYAIIKDFLKLSSFLIDVKLWSLTVRHKKGARGNIIRHTLHLLSNLGIRKEKISVKEAIRIDKTNLKLWISNSLCAIPI